MQRWLSAAVLRVLARVTTCRSAHHRRRRPDLERDRFTGEQPPPRRRCRLGARDRRVPRRQRGPHVARRRHPEDPSDPCRRREHELTPQRRGRRPPAPTTRPTSLAVTGGSFAQSPAGRSARRRSITSCAARSIAARRADLGADLGLYSVTFDDNDVNRDLESLEAYEDFSIEAEKQGFPALPGDVQPQRVRRHVHRPTGRADTSTTDRAHAGGLSARAGRCS